MADVQQLPARVEVLLVQHDLRTHTGRRKAKTALRNFLGGLTILELHYLRDHHGCPTGLPLSDHLIYDRSPTCT